MASIQLSDRIYIPIKEIPNIDPLMKSFTHYFFEESACKGCEYYIDRPSNMCLECERGGLADAVCLINEKRIKGKPHYGFPMGSRGILEKKGVKLDRFKIIDKRSAHKFRHKVKFTGKLRDYQVPVVNGWLKVGYGMIQAPPRSGKTVMSLFTAIEKGYRIIIIADQKDFLDGFYETIETMTNLPEIEKKTGKKLFGFLEKDSDFEQYEIALCTYQKFLHQSKKRLKLLNDNYGFIWTDEIHRAGANCFSKFLASVKMKYRGGCSATPRRKDKRHNIVFQVIGKVTGKTEVDTLIPKRKVHTIYESTPRRQYSGGKGSWVYAMKHLCKCEARNQIILQRAIKDIENGRSVVIPLMFRDHITWFVKNINEHFDRSGNRPVAAAFVGGQKEKKKRKEIIDKARRYEIKCVVGVRKLLQLGLNVPRWDTLYYVLPMSNKENWEQESARILTPATPESQDKKSPLIRMYVDPGMGQSLGCFRTTWNFSNEFKFESSPISRRIVELLGIQATGENDRITPATRNSLFADDYEPASRRLL